MKEGIKNLLKQAGVYHGLQSAYRSFLFTVVRQYNRLHYAKFKGSGFTCNFCRHQYSRFVPESPSPSQAGAIVKNNVVAGYGENVYCPWCMSKNRERLLLALFEHDIEAEGKAILHFSPERNLYRYLAGKTTVTAADLQPGFYKKIAAAIQEADATKLQYADASFDMVIANHILEHIPDDQMALREICRVLKPGGLAILQVPFSATNTGTIEEPFIGDPAKQEALFGQRDHVRIYGLDDYLVRTAAAGFRNRPVTPGQLSRFEKFAIQKGEFVFLCYKPA